MSKKNYYILPVVAALGLAGCTDVPGGAVSDGLIGTGAQFDSMTPPCIDQAGRLTGQPLSTVVITDRIPTGGGPILTLTAAGAPYTCRLEDNGTVTVFSEYAN